CSVLIPRGPPHAVEHGFRDAVRRRDEPFGDYGRQASRV
ncbi:hypothetical protein, partial [Mycobacterium tuberculosis]